MDAQVAVIGLGSMGSAALWQLASRGVATVGFEQFEPGHDRGAGHGETKIYRTAYGEGPEYVPLVRAALPLWRRLEEETGRPLLTMNGGLMIGPLGTPFMSGVLASIREYDLLHEVLDPEQAERRFPQVRMSEDEHLIWEPRAGFLRPELAVVTASERARRLGATIVTGARVSSVLDHGDHVEIRAGDWSYRVERAVVASGAWFQKVFSAPDTPFWVERQVQGWFPVDDPALWHPERMGIYSRVAGPDNWYGFPTLDGRSVKVAFHHHGGRPSDPDRLDREVRASDIDPLAEVLMAGLRGVGPVPIKTQVCMYINTPDEHFLLGPLPDAPRIVLAGPMAGHGFKFAPVIGQIAADLATTGETEHPIESFDPARFPQLAGMGRA
jgi:sarcosine oxidase